MFINNIVRSNIVTLTNLNNKNMFDNVKTNAVTSTNFLFKLLKNKEMAHHNGFNYIQHTIQ